MVVAQSPKGMNLTLCLTLSSEFNPLFNLKVLVNSGSLGLWRRHTLQEDRHTTRGAIVILSLACIWLDRAARTVLPTTLRGRRELSTATQTGYIYHYHT